MYGFPKEIELEDIVGSEIQQICLGPSDVQFKFGSGREIHVESLLEIFKEDELLTAWDIETKWTNASFQKLLMVKIEGYGLLSDRLLEIRFEHGLRLLLHDNSNQFESIKIYPEFIIV